MTDQKPGPEQEAYDRQLAQHVRDGSWEKPGPEPTEEQWQTARELCPRPKTAEHLNCRTCVRIALALAHEREKAAKVAEDPSNYDMIGGSTGNAYGTGQLIAAAIRSGGRE